MGLLKHVLLWPVTVPAAVVEFSVRQVEGIARRELTDDQRVKEDLMALQMALELGEIDDDEYARREAALMRRLREVREWRQHFGMEERWAPLSYGSPSAETGPPPPREQEPPGDEPWPPTSSDTSGDGS